MHRLLTFGGRVFGRLSRELHASAQRRGGAEIQRDAVLQSSSYDMLTAPDEAYYAEQYWTIIEPHLAPLREGALVLDLGCGQGRLALKIASKCPSSQIRGCDISPAAVSAARKHAADAAVSNVAFMVQSIRERLAETADGSVDAVVMTEVTFFYPEWRDDVPAIARCLRPGGVAVMSFRPQYFYAMVAARDRNWYAVDPILDARQGRILGDSTTYTWQSSDDVRQLVAGEPTLQLLELRGIGSCSGIPGDPHDVLCRPSVLGAEERGALSRLELEIGRSVPDGGRYMLAILRKQASR